MKWLNKQVGFIVGAATLVGAILGGFLAIDTRYTKADNHKETHLSEKKMQQLQFLEIQIVLQEAEIDRYNEREERGNPLPRDSTRKLRAVERLNRLESAKDELLSE